MKSRIRLAVALVVAATVAVPAFAQRTPPTPEEREARFVAADTNKDGKLSKDELTAMLPDQMKDRADMMFTRMDADGDGFVTKEEFMAMRRGGGGGAGGGAAPQ
ncbi:MAG: RNA polymerase subunit sigma-70 [Alphaproteobacteria bacterium]|nr:RNA polymerase subunit sigma-70 [Alphaproteobacteria bacterium]